MVGVAQSGLVRHLFFKGQPVTYGKGEVILGNELTPRWVYYISSGYVKTYSISNDGNEYLHLINKPGEIFPLVWALLDAEPEAVYHETISECTVWRISKEWLNESIKHDIKLCYALVLLLAEQFRIYSDRIDNLEYKKAEERVAYRILFMASRLGRPYEGGTKIDVPITHETIANSINLARESVSREMQRLEQQNIIQLVDHKIIIPNIEALAQKLSKPVNLKTMHLL